MTPFDRSHIRVPSYWRTVQSIVNMAISCIKSEMKRGIGRKSRFFHTPPVFNAPGMHIMRWPRRNFAQSCLALCKLEWLGYHITRKALWRVYSIPEHDKRTDRQMDVRTDNGRTELLYQYSASATLSFAVLSRVKNQSVGNDSGEPLLIRTKVGTHA